MVTKDTRQVERMKKKQTENSTEHGKIRKQHSILIGPETASQICGAYAFRGPIRIIGEQAPQLVLLGSHSLYLAE